ncbi:unnamed protein product [Brassica napus]|uniref:(rape) hypothetical protein n=1 Tax=Brassica napus TaxID=3708 RepID=A0A816NQ02_BRANA|nr:unnamed protein product [Brassica napus]
MFTYFFQIFSVIRDFQVIQCSKTRGCGTSHKKLYNMVLFSQ